MEINERETNGIVILDLKGRLDSTNAVDFGNRLRAVFTHTGRRLLLNLQGIEFISSAGFRALLIASRQATQSSGSLVLCNLAPKVRELFEMGGFIDNFEIRPTREEGIAALS